MRKHTRRSRNRIAVLPDGIRTEINRRLRNGWKFTTIRKWLFTQKADQEVPDLNLQVGDLYSLGWTRTVKSQETAHVSCELALASWFQAGYREWLREELKQTKSIRVLKEMQELSSVAGEEARPEAVLGGNVLIQSMLLETIKVLHEEDTDPKELARLATAWARLNQSATENEKVKIRTQDSVDAGLEALKAEITKNPETVALFKKLHDAVKGSTEPTA
jgi:hypothetical protein